MEAEKDYSEMIENETLNDFLKRQLLFSEEEYLRLRDDIPLHPMMTFYMNRILKLRLMIEEKQADIHLFQKEMIDVIHNILGTAHVIYTRHMDVETKKTLTAEVNSHVRQSIDDLRYKQKQRDEAYIKTLKKYARQ
jgi:hypothetical protein